MEALRASASKPLLTALSLGLIALLGWIDYLAGLEYSVAILYLTPVFITAWFVGRRVAVATAFAGAAAWLLAGAALFRQEDIPAALFWNDLVQLGIFLVVAYSLSALRSALEHEKATARTDDLTGAPNRRHFYDPAEREIERQRRYGGTFSIACIDIDNFKEVNDTFGLGAILLPETGEEAALADLAKIREERALRARRAMARLAQHRHNYLWRPSVERRPDVQAGRHSALQRKARRKGSEQPRDGGAAPCAGAVSMTLQDSRPVFGVAFFRSPSGREKKP